MPTSRNEIKTGKIYIKEVFAQWFTIPEYQRPYVWTRDEVTDLLDDISYASENTPDNDYFLGSFVYQHMQPTKNDEFPENDLLDGQQRITTLFLIFAVIRDLTDNPRRKQSCQEYIFQQKDDDKGTPERVRLLYKIREAVEDFINEFVVPPNSIIDRWEELNKIAANEGDTTIKNMANAIIHIRKFFEERNNIDTFFPYMLKYVIMIFVYSEQLEDAFRLFTILNDRGVKLRNSDILKAQNLQHVPAHEKLKYGRKWEELETNLGDEFDRFLSFVRTIIVKEKARLNLLNEFEENIYSPREKDKQTGLKKSSLLQRGKPTFDLIEKYYNHYEQVFENDNYSFTNSYHFNNLLVCMKTALPSTDWVPPLLSYYDKFGEKEIMQFLQKLDNKFSADWICQYSPTERIEEMNAVLKGIEKAASPQELFDTKLFDIETDYMFNVLNGSIYGKQFTKYILLKLDYLFNDNHAHKWSVFSNISVEHILPQNPEDSSSWVQHFTEEERNAYTNKIGNLILLGRRKNSSQGRMDYPLKHARYFANNINTFPNSLRVFNKYTTVWTRHELEENHNFVLERLKGCYR